jgi:S1-C subfamily serine protease
MASFSPRISRDTRWLLIIIAVSIAALSILARVRFRDGARIPGPIAPVLSQLKPRSSFEEMTVAIGELLPRLRAIVVPLALPADAGTGDTFVPAISIADGLVAAVAPSAGRPSAPAIARFDKSTRLAVVRLPEGATNRMPAVWEPADAPQPRVFAAVTAPSGQVTARPVFVAALTASTSARWASRIWVLGDAPPLTEGSLLFTLEGALAGVVVTLDGRQAVVPWPAVVSEAERVLAAPDAPPGGIDVEVQALTAVLRAATGATHGVVVSWVAPAGPAAALVRVGDVITTVDGQPVSSPAEWAARRDRLAAGQAVTLTLWRAGGAVAVTVLARHDGAPAQLPLGLRLRTVARVGARIESVAPGSAGEHAGLRAGDLLTRVADIDAPTEAQARRAFQTATTERPLLLAVTRGDSHFVLAMDRRW